jgi:hypothetical protein
MNGTGNINMMNKAVYLEDLAVDGIIILQWISKK